LAGYAQDDQPFHPNVSIGALLFDLAGKDTPRRFEGAFRTGNFMRKTMLTAAAMVLSLGATALAADARKPEYGTWGQDTAAIDPSVKPGDDFFGYVNGKWLKTEQIPADRTFTGIDLTIDNTLKPRLRALVEEAAKTKAAAGSVQQKIGDFYASYMDEAGIEAKGLQPIKAELDALENMNTKAELAMRIGMLSKDGVTTPVGGYVDIDAKKPTRYLFRFYQTGLSFNDRDYYLKDTAEFKKLREQFRAHVERMLKLSGVKNAAEQAGWVLALETGVAKVHWPLEKARDDELTYNLWPRAKLDSLGVGYTWKQILEPVGVDKQTEFLVGQPDTLEAVSKQIDSVPLHQWKAYLRYQMLVAYAQFLPKAFDDERFAFYGTIVRGQPKQQERWRRGMDLLSNNMGEPLGQLYVAKYFPPSAKADMQAMIGHFRTAFGALIDKAAWMSASTKKEAHAKLAAFGAKLGYPDKWKDYSGLKVERGDVVGNVRRATDWEVAYQIGKLGKPIYTHEWLMVPQENNAYYWPQRNEIVFPAGILQAPYYDPAADLASNYGEIGATIGHEMSHGFDDQGRKSDSKGVLRDWWTKEDAARYTAEAQKLVKQYNSYEPIKGLHINGQQTLGENIADLAGLIIAYDAYKVALGGKPAPVIDGLTGDQRFFLAYAQSWRVKYREERLRDLLVSDVHSPAMARVNGAVRNVDAWYAAFNVKPGEKLYLKPEERVRPW
jgi:putative endopeptidase